MYCDGRWLRHVLRVNLLKTLKKSATLSASGESAPLHLLRRSLAGRQECRGGGRQGGEDDDRQLSQATRRRRPRAALLCCGVVLCRPRALGIRHDRGFLRVQGGRPAPCTPSTAGEPLPSTSFFFFFLLPSTSALSLDRCAGPVHLRRAHHTARAQRPLCRAPPRR